MKRPVVTGIGFVTLATNTFAVAMFAKPILAVTRFEYPETFAFPLKIKFEVVMVLETTRFPDTWRFADAVLVPIPTFER